MKREDLFAAIGEVEESRLARTELAVQGPSAIVTKEEPAMKKKRVSTKRIIRNILVAAIIVSMLGVTVYAVGGYLIFESPEEMVTAIFGDQTGFDHGARGEITDKDGNVLAQQYRHDRVPADEAVVQQEVAPLVEAVGKSISWNGYTLTIDANLYDHATECGLVTYLLENPNGLSYSLQKDGQVWFPDGELVGFSHYGYSYIIQEQSSSTKLAATYYYQLRDRETTDLEISFTQWASVTQEEINQRIEEIKQQLRQEISEEEALEFQKAYVGDSWPWFEENRTREENIDAAYEAWAYERLEKVTTCPDKIVIPEQPQSEMASITLGDGAVTLSPIAMTLDMLAIDDGSGGSHTIVIAFADGSEYVVEEDYTLNYVFHVGDAEGKESTYMFNRIIDVQDVAAVIIDDNVELTVD